MRISAIKTFIVILASVAHLDATHVRATMLRYITENTKNALPYAKPQIARKRARLSWTFFQATCSKLIRADNIRFFFKFIVEFRRKICLSTNATSISLLPIEFNGKNGVFGLPVAQKLIR